MDPTDASDLRVKIVKPDVHVSMLKGYEEMAILGRSKSAGSTGSVR
jgi:hypothetical protein